MKIKSASLLFNSAVKLMALNAAAVPATDRQVLRMRTPIGRVIFLVLLTILSWAKLSQPKVAADRASRHLRSRLLRFARQLPSLEQSGKVVHNHPQSRNLSIFNGLYRFLQREQCGIPIATN